MPRHLAWVNIMRQWRKAIPGMASAAAAPGGIISLNSGCGVSWRGWRRNALAASLRGIVKKWRKSCINTAASAALKNKQRNAMKK